MMRSPLIPQELEKVKQLIAAYRTATANVQAALEQCTADRMVSKIALSEDLRASDALRSIREIYGDAAPSVSTASAGYTIK